MIAAYCKYEYLILNFEIVEMKLFQKTKSFQKSIFCRNLYINESETTPYIKYNRVSYVC